MNHYKEIRPRMAKIKNLTRQYLESAPDDDDTAHLIREIARLAGEMEDHVDEG